MSVVNSEYEFVVISGVACMYRAALAHPWPLKWHEHMSCVSGYLVHYEKYIL